MRILFFLFDAIGDFLVCTPFLENFRKAHPNAFIGVVAHQRNINLARKNGYIDAVHLFHRSDFRLLSQCIREIRTQRYDVLADIFHSRFSTAQKLLVWLSGAGKKIALEKRSQFRELKYNHYFDAIIAMQDGHVSKSFNHVLAHLGAPPVTEPRYTYSIEDCIREEARKHICWHAVNIVLVCQGSRKNNTLPLPILESLAQKLLGAIPEAGIYLSAAPGKGNPASMLAARLATPRVKALPDINGNLDFTAAAVERADLLISTGTGTLHLGGAFDTPTIGIYPLGEMLFLPITSKQAVVRSQHNADSWPVDEKEIVTSARKLLFP